MPFMILIEETFLFFGVVIGEVLLMTCITNCGGLIIIVVVLAGGNPEFG
jgi:hypothetical protein